MGPRIGILALQGDVAEHSRALMSLETEVVLVRTEADLAGLDGIVLPGGESTTIAKLARRFGVFEPLQAAIRNGLPAYGSCAGMILLADRVVDGVAGQETLACLDICVRRNAFGRQRDSFETDVQLTGLRGGPVRAVLIRAPWVEEVGPAVQVLATIESHPVAVRHRNVLVTSFHPEVTHDLRVHQLFLAMVNTARASS